MKQPPEFNGQPKVTNLHQLKALIDKLPKVFNKKLSPNGLKRNVQLIQGGSILQAKAKSAFKPLENSQQIIQHNKRPVPDPSPKSSV